MPTVPVGELDLWSLRAPPPVGGPSGLAAGELDREEHERAAAFVRPHDRLQYLAAHIALRRLLAAYTGMPPDRMRFGRDGPGGRRGRPTLLGAPVPLHFSLSHSHGLVLFGVASTPVGVDVQRVPSRETTELCLSKLHPQERAELVRLAADARPLVFGRLWTRKEAYLKGLGTGLARSPAADYLGEHRGGAAPARPTGWTVRNVPAAPGHVAATALRTEEEHRITVRRLPPECLYVRDPADAARAIAAVPEETTNEDEKGVGPPCRPRPPGPMSTTG
ncbi:4'-phosphopantetheinyl transferase superfamily protein [Streptomyces sp. NPDC005820]|uniref:4'-phosphopantetheinyl transferase family protein n=1 Tax=Streptomyces sp. NPDC005820 TaxID=3157069 RepID=UPI0033CDF736